MSTKRRGLGRGLDALLKAEPSTEESAETPSSAPPSGFRTLMVGQLQPNRFQPRHDFDTADLEELADSIRAQGVVQPIVVAPLGEDRYSIIAGERRWRASQQAGLQEVPVVVREVSGDQELLELALVENLQRTDLNPVEEAEAYRSLQDSFGLSQEQVAQRVGKARSTITNGLRLLRLAPEVQDLLRSGSLTAGQARPLLSLPTEKGQVELARKAVEEGLSARQLEKLATASESKSKKAAKEPDDVEVHAAAAAEKLTRSLQTPVDIKRRGKGGIVSIRFHSEEELMRLYDLLMARGTTE
ncbi:MAG: ParB/RepB/Spo0J family partition protein [Acidobacteriota bacterium]|nr:ParB/RepB/Spo0J family partition protein [Acidobacteriota bacterium]